MTKQIDQIMADFKQREIDRTTKLDIFVGMGATYSIGSDSYPLTVVAVEGVKGKRKITCTYDNYRATKNSDYYGHQSYLYTSTTLEEGRKQYFQEKDCLHQGDNFLNSYRPAHLNQVSGRLNKVNYGCIHLGEKEAHKDPHF